MKVEGKLNLGNERPYDAAAHLIAFLVVPVQPLAGGDGNQTVAHIDPVSLAPCRRAACTIRDPAVQVHCAADRPRQHHMASHRSCIAMVSYSVSRETPCRIGSCKSLDSPCSTKPMPELAAPASDSAQH